MRRATEASPTHADRQSRRTRAQDDLAVAGGDYVAPDPPEIRLPTRRRFSYDFGLVKSAVAEAYALRVTAERALARGRGDEDHPDLVALRSAVAARTNWWRHEGQILGPPRPAPHQGGDLREGRSGSPSLDAAVAIAGVLGGDSTAISRALHARVTAIRREMGWASASPLVRDVIDQFALATAHVEVIRACAAVFDEGGAPDSTTDGADSEDPMVEMLEQLAEACGKPLPTATGPDDQRSRDGRNRRVWERRLSRAECGLRRAARLVRHARKAGWISPETSASADLRSDSSDSALYSHPLRKYFGGWGRSPGSADGAHPRANAHPPPRRGSRGGRRNAGADRRHARGVAAAGEDHLGRTRRAGLPLEPVRLRGGVRRRWAARRWGEVGRPRRGAGDAGRAAGRPRIVGAGVRGACCWPSMAGPAAGVSLVQSPGFESLTFAISRNRSMIPESSHSPNCWSNPKPSCAPQA